MNGRDTLRFSQYSDGLIGLPLSHIWRGYGSAIFLEFGRLTANHQKRMDGSEYNPRGEFGLMIQWSWRIENATSILCGSWSDEVLWQPAFDLILGKTVIGLSLFGRLQEISVSLSDDLHVASFMTAEGDPEWALFDRRTATSKALGFKDGALMLTQRAK